MKLQLICVAAVALIQSAFVASHEVPSFRGVSLLDDAKDAAAAAVSTSISSSDRFVLVPLSPRAMKLSRSQVAPVKPAETDAPAEKKDELADETEERRR